MIIPSGGDCATIPPRAEGRHYCTRPRGAGAVSARREHEKSWVLHTNCTKNLPRASLVGAKARRAQPGCRALVARRRRADASDIGHCFRRY
eukprot:723668-Prymnesium_polylepis.1